MNKIKLIAIKDNIPSNSKKLSHIIEEKRLLNTKIKLMNISYIDHDLKTLHQNNFDLLPFCLEDFYLTNDFQLIALLKAKITFLKSKENTLILSYLIYLSYLYNYDFYNLYFNNYPKFKELINTLNLPLVIKDEILSLKNMTYFSNFIDYLSTSLSKQLLEEDKKRLLVLR